MKFLLPASSFADKDGIETGRIALEYGFDGVELWGDGLLLLTEAEVEDAYNFFKSTSLVLTVHLPYLDINIASANPDIRRLSLDLSIKALITARRIGARLAVVHTGKPTGTSRLGDFLHINISSSEDSLYRLLQVANMTSTTIAIENGVKRELFSQMENFFSLIRRFSSAKICLDTGHANVMKWNYAILKNSYDIVEKIAYIHAHDNNGKHDQHMPVGRGTIEWNKIAPLLKDKLINLEIRSFTDISEFIESREILKETMR